MCFAFLIGSDRPIAARDVAAGSRVVEVRPSQDDTRLRVVGRKYVAEVSTDGGGCCCDLVLPIPQDWMPQEEIDSYPDARKAQVHLLKALEDHVRYIADPDITLVYYWEGELAGAVKDEGYATLGSIMQLDVDFPFRNPLRFKVRLT
ncbi:MAG: hypothetical protein RL291_1673 [Pseudomonadota bacterium]|jgi:hypothetical protein